MDYQKYYPLKINKPCNYLGLFSKCCTIIKKEYDCMKSVRVERDRISHDTEEMSPKEIIEYFSKKKKDSGQLKNKYSNII